MAVKAALNVALNAAANAALNAVLLVVLPLPLFVVCAALQLPCLVCPPQQQ